MVHSIRTARSAWLAAPLLFVLGGAARADAPTYEADGRLSLPADYREWVFLSSGLDMSYSEAARKDGHPVFDNVFVTPAAWAAFKRSGHWPDKTVFALEIRRANSRGSINKRGAFQSEPVLSMEFHVRDTARFKGGWGFFESDGKSAAKLFPPSEDCYACHATHGALDSTFVQFYPTAKAIALRAGTFKQATPAH